MGNIKPLAGWVLIEPEKEESQTIGGIRLPDSSQDIPMRGKIIRCSKGYWLPDGMLHINDEIKEENIVLYRKYSGQTVKHEGKELKLIEFKDLLAVIEEGDESK